MFAPRGTSASKALRLLDVTGELLQLAAIQKERLDKALYLEDQTPILQGMVSDVIRDYRATLLALNGVYIDLGFTPRAKAGKAFRAKVAGEGSMEFAWVEGMDERFAEAIRELEGLNGTDSEPDGNVFDAEPS